MDFQKNNETLKSNFLFNQNYPKKVDFGTTNIEEDVYRENLFNNKDRIAIYNRNKNNQKFFLEDLIEDDIEVLKPELSDEQEKIDDVEENNYYSFGDDDDN